MKILSYISHLNHLPIMTGINKTGLLIQEVARARNEFVATIKNITEAQAAFKPLPTAWNITDITEHLFWAEQGALYGMWKILYAIREGQAPKTFESDHKDWTVEEIIAQTWREKEEVPASAAPRMGGTLKFWRHSLTSLQPILEAFGKDLQDEELRMQAHPHPISGAMDFQQWFEFLRFHLDRHKEQVKGIIGQFTS